MSSRSSFASAPERKTHVTAKLRRGAYCSEGAILAKKRFSLDGAPSLLSDAPHLTTCLTWQHVRLAGRLV